MVKDIAKARSIVKSERQGDFQGQVSTGASQEIVLVGRRGVESPDQSTPKYDSHR